ncbi:MAG: hypothetical protein HDS86_00085 [Bacteroidales bacterium]|nr:hypothetical protein [Bacteroidales bacterium]
MKSGRSNKLRLLPIIAATVAAAMTIAVESCNDIGCTDLRSSIPLAGFYSSSSESQVTLDSLLIGGVGAPHDSLLVDSGAHTSSLYLPFRAEKPSTSYFIKYVSKGLDFTELIDTITFDYTSTAYFASADCGAMFIYDIKSVSYTRHLIDSVGITDSLINNMDMERIKVFFRTSEEL